MRIVRNHPLARVQISRSKKIVEYKEVVHHRHPYLLDVWCTMDCLKLMLKQSGNALIHEQFYKCWKHDHYVMMSLMCFCTDGTILIVFCNIPGTVHDSQATDYGDMYHKLEAVYLQDGAKCTVVSAFGNVIRDLLIKSSHELIHI